MWFEPLRLKCYSADLSWLVIDPIQRFVHDPTLFGVKVKSMLVEERPRLVERVERGAGNLRHGRLDAAPGHAATMERDDIEGSIL